MYIHSPDIGDLFTVNSELLPVADKWRKIGLALRLDPDLLSRIRGNHSDVEDCLEDVLTKWLKKAYDVTRFGAPSWKLLVEAVAHRAGGNDRALAERIARKYKGTCTCNYMYMQVSCLLPCFLHYLTTTCTCTSPSLPSHHPISPLPLYSASSFSSAVNFLPGNIL